MLIKNKVVHNCPVTRASQGRLTLSREVVAAVAGAVGEDAEWAVFLLGTRSEDGMDVSVTGWEVVPGQRRASADVDWQHETEASQPDGCVGVMHLHPRELGAFFSHKDRTALNPRFPVSIVVSPQLVDDQSAWLGWSWQAEGRVKLPCGALGRVGFVVEVEGLLQPDWGFGVSADSAHGDCDRVDIVEASATHDVWQPRCGKVLSRYVAKGALAGRTARLLKQLPPVEAPQMEAGFKWWKSPKFHSARSDEKLVGGMAEKLQRFNELDALAWHEMTDAEFDEYELLEAELWKTEGWSQAALYDGWDDPAADTLANGAVMDVVKGRA